MQTSKIHSNHNAKTCTNTFNARFIVRLDPPNFWSVVDNIDNAFPRTQNSVEAWHRRWETIVGCAHACKCL